MRKHQTNPNQDSARGFLALGEPTLFPSVTEYKKA